LKPYLLDINVLIALAWPSHVHHSLAQAWFASNRTAGFRTCPITQSGFVRISSNPKFIPDAVAPRQALALLERIVSAKEHEFWPDDLPVADAIAETDLVVGHSQVMDAYLIALAHHHGGLLATLDSRTLSLGRTAKDAVELLGHRS